MKTMRLMLAACGLLLAALACHPTLADVLNMGGTHDPATGQWTGLASLETVPVGNAGNAGELSGASAGGWWTYGPDRICGGVNYQYRIGKYEVTAGQYCEFLNAVATTDTYGLYCENMAYTGEWPWGCNIQRSGSPGSYTYSVAPDWANRPVNYVNFGDVCRFANWLHNGQPSGAQDSSTTEDGAYLLNGATVDSPILRTVTRKADARWAIPTEDEWYKAAYHKNDGVTGNYYDYPTRSDTAPGQDLADASGNNDNYNGSFHSNPSPVQPPYYTTAAGQFRNSGSPYGTFDQGGNVAEWTETIRDSVRVVRGTAFCADDLYMQACYRGYASTYMKNYDGGFRVVQVPEPATLSLLALGGLLIARRRRV